MAEADPVPGDGDLARRLEDEIARIEAGCVAAGAVTAAGFLRANRARTLQIAMAARKEPKTAGLPSPFIYSMQ